MVIVFVNRWRCICKNNSNILICTFDNLGYKIFLRTYFFYFKHYFQNLIMIFFFKMYIEYKIKTVILCCIIKDSPQSLMQSSLSKVIISLSL